MMKKLTFILLITFAFSIFPTLVNAETIADYRARISAIKAEKSASESKGAAVQEKIDSAKTKIAEITREIAATQRERENTLNEIDKLKEEMKAKNQEIKDLVAFYQVSENDNFYLKFIFGADNFEDLIYRFSVAEQLTDANDKLIDEMNVLVKENNEKIKELETQQKKLNGLSEEMDAQVKKLGNQKRQYTEDALDADEEIDAINKQIAYFKKKGCGENQNVATCSSGVVPSSSGFQLPLAHGTITTYYGYGVRSDIGESYARLHAGMDYGIGCGTPIMATNSGEVIHAGWYYGYGNAVIIVHNVRGTMYTSLYGHMSRVTVSTGQNVTRGQTIGAVGNTGYSFGCHLHFQTMYGTGHNDSNSFNPQNLMSVPYSW